MKTDCGQLLALCHPRVQRIKEADCSTRVIPSATMPEIAIPPTQAAQSISQRTIADAQSSAWPVAEVRAGGLEQVEELEAEWRTLCLDGSADGPFCRPEWLATLMRVCKVHRNLLLVTVRDGGKLAAVLPLVAQRGFFCGFPVMKLRPPTHGLSPRFDLVCVEGPRRQPVTWALWRGLRDLPGWDLLELSGITHDTPIDQLLRAAKQLDDFPIGYWEAGSSPYISLTSTDGAFVDPVQGCDAHFRHELRRFGRKAERLGPLRLRRVDRADPEWIRKFLELERSGWKGRAGSAITQKPNEPQFYMEIACWAERAGCLSLYFLEAQEQLLAAQFGLTYRKRYYALKCAFNEQHRDCAPGHLLLHELLRDCARRGVVECDLLGNCDEWKKRWAPSQRGFRIGYVFRNNLLGQLLYKVKFKLRPAVRRLLNHSA
jgi:CelD/BcsL family acetyltransferase involved in cellulose biosynthesis